MEDTTPSQLATELVNEISKFLVNGQIKEAESAIYDNKYSACLKDNSWDLIPVVTKYLDEQILMSKPDLFECCENLLQVVAEKSNPEEALLEFIEQAELAKNDTKFLAILKALQKTLLKLTSKRGRSLEWTFNTIQAHVSELPLPGDYNLESDEKIILDADTAVNRITLLYDQLLPFYKPFICEVALPTHLLLEHKQRRDLLACFMLQLLGKPLACLDLECNVKSKNRARLCAEKIMNYLSELMSDCFKLLEYVIEKPPKTPSDKNGVYEEPVEDVFACEDKTPQLSLGVYYYLLLSENIEMQNRPCNYSPLYIFQKVLFLVNELLKQPEQFVTRKGILLAYAIICGPLIPTLTHDTLDSPAHCNFSKSLTNVMIYSDVKESRELCLKIFKIYLFKFDTKGRYLLISNLMDSITHVNTRGYIISQYKDMLREILSNSNVYPISKYFSGQKLYRMLNVFCLLPQGRESDLMEIGDQIITSLNLLIFLAIRDKSNITGVWYHFSTLQKTFFKPLKEAINISRAHYELKIKELNDEKKLDSKVNVTVKCKPLEPMTHKEKLAVLNSALNSFSALEMLLARIEELIEDDNLMK